MSRSVLLLELVSSDMNTGCEGEFGRPAPSQRGNKRSRSPLLTNIKPQARTLLVNYLDGSETCQGFSNSLVGLTPPAYLLWIRHPGMNIPAMEGVLSCRIEQRLT